MTLPLIAALGVMPASARARVESLFASDAPDDGAIAEVIGIVAEQGGLDYARQAGSRFAAQAEETLVALPETVARTALIDSISYVMERHA